MGSHGAAGLREGRVLQGDGLSAVPGKPPLGRAMRLCRGARRRWSRQRCPWHLLGCRGAPCALAAWKRGELQSLGAFNSKWNCSPSPVSYPRASRARPLQSWPGQDRRRSAGVLSGKVNVSKWTHPCTPAPMAALAAMYPAA